jgi:hypothetical protein
MGNFTEDTFRRDLIDTVTVFILKTDGTVFIVYHGAGMFANQAITTRVQWPFLHIATQCIDTRRGRDVQGAGAGSD